MTTKKITYEEADRRFKQHHNEIEIIKETYVSWNKKAMFYDHIVAKTFISRPKDVFNNRSVHPVRRKEKQLKSYRIKKPLKEKKTDVNFIETRKQTCVEKYGVDNPSKIDWVKRKKEETSKKNWGVAQPLAATEIREKIKKTNVERYGGTSPISHDNVKNKIKETCVKKYGVDHYSKTTTFSEQQSKLVLCADGKELTLSNWLALTTYNKTLPSKTTINHWFAFEDKINEKELIHRIEEFGSYKSGLELIVEKEFGFNHYNKKPIAINNIYRPDFKINELLYMNVDGLFWHKSDFKDRHYHFEMRKEFEKHNLRILQFREDEIRNKIDIVRSIVSNASGLTGKKIYARKTYVAMISNEKAVKFLNCNHLKGAKKAKHIGLFVSTGELVSVLSWKIYKNVCKIERFCSTIGMNVVGGLSKLLTALEKHLANVVNEYHYWVDLRYGTGNQLKRFGYSLSHETIGFDWTDGKQCYNRLYCRSTKTTTEKEEAKNRNLYKIYDAGQRLWIKRY